MVKEIGIQYDMLKYKVQARKKLARFYYNITGQVSIPADKQYWTLCAMQTNRTTSEINQLTKLGLITKEQFNGVDRSEEIIKANKETHPEASWYFGEWDTVLRRNSKKFNPAIVYLDFTSMAMTRAVINMVLQTMSLCELDTFVFVNVMLNNPRDPRVRFKKEDFIEKLYHTTYKEFIDKWKFYNQAIVYCATGWTRMATYPFRKVKI
jgi:hypothetical protein